MKSIYYLLFLLTSLRLSGQSDTTFADVTDFYPNPPGTIGNFILESELKPTDIFFDQNHKNLDCKFQKIYDTTGIYKTANPILICDILTCYSCYYKNGKLAMMYYLNNYKLTGPYIKYYEEGQIMELKTYLLDVPIGKHLEYYPDGIIKISGEYCFKEELVNKYDSRINIVQTEETLEVKTFYELYQVEYKESTWKYFNPKGILIKEESFFCGKKNGEWKFYDDNGLLINTEIWEDNKLIEKH